MSASAIAIMVLSLTLAILISLIVYALMTKHVPFLGWKVEAKNRRRDSWLRRGPGGEDIGELPRRQTVVVDPTVQYPG